ncbi:MAG: hypothetical protein K8T25_00465 [Planctomycetia bacterium]|nr:hypothetical protein [Planctomycetia bacterium]
MNAFLELRKQARARRDTLVKDAREEYRTTLVKIATLEHRITGRQAAKPSTLTSRIHSVIPTEGTFTTEDITTALEALEPGVVWRRATIDNAIGGLRRKGLIRRISKAKSSVNGLASRAVYTRVDSDVAPIPFEGMTLPDVIHDVLKGKSLNRTELTMALIDAGYRTSMTRKGLRDHVGRLLRADKRFSKSGDRWGVVS